jgi:hypothetical protein
MRNEYARAMAKEVQKLWDSNAADVKKLRESLSAQFAELEQNLKHRTEFQMQLVRALGEGFEERQSDALASLREALRSYKAGKGRKLIEAKMRRRYSIFLNRCARRIRTTTCRRRAKNLRIRCTTNWKKNLRWQRCRAPG